MIAGATGSGNMQARYYDPLIGRFLSTDPIGYQDQLNLYAYVGNDPVNMVDPDGRQVIGATNYAQTLNDAGCHAECSAKAGMAALKGAAGIANDVLNPFSDVGEFVSDPSAGTAVIAAAGALPGPNVAKLAKRFSNEKAALVDMAKQDKRSGGISEDDMQAYKDLNSELPDAFPENAVRGPEAHPGRGHGSQPHGHVGPVDHIPIKPDELE